MGSGDRDLGPEFVEFMGFAFGYVADMWFVKAIDLCLSVLFCRKMLQALVSAAEE